MRSLSKRFSALIITSAILGSAEVSAAAEKVVIVTQSTPETGSTKVAARIWRRADTGSWEEIDGERPEIGVLEVAETKCDISVSYKAAAMWGTHTRDVTATHSCHEPQVVFNDFIPTGIADAINLEQLTNSTAWVAALGTSPGDGERFAQTFQTAILQGNYGTVAIAGSEISAQLRKAGNSRDADVFAALSVQATLSGIAKANKIEPEALNVGQIDTANYAAIGDDAKSALETYQKTIGLEKTSPGFGKTGWATMRSLEGGNTTAAAQWKLSPSAAIKFDASHFSLPKE
ncbi:hypothetical protein HGP17_23840 [Rhizobium sp. P38BS-XIX]|uniref:hypothetical protein n=1 Tax=Rhizobium sp. P38BS-XIX TaxID=2726740 RepID=UPI0014568092|nr:hypothetical protein [Rhizobium sp. P38BS-XIX]NLR99865.1 hypothetical protein [Rhizobium sp. P38BS-XIX]